MRIPIFQVDAFTSHLFGGNPAAICPLTEPLPADLMQSIALENQLSETAFLVPSDQGFDLRWFTPVGEINLCGHATIASGHVVMTEFDRGADQVLFQTMSGQLSVNRRSNGYRLDLPSWPGDPISIPQELVTYLGARPLEVRRTDRDWYAIFEGEAVIRTLNPDFKGLASLPTDGIGVGAPGDEVDIVSRFFAPALAVAEDPVTGSAHSTWIPWFAERTARTEFQCRQLSARGGELLGTLENGRVQLDGACVTYLWGEIEV